MHVVSGNTNDRHSSAESYKDLEPQQIYRMHENEKKRQYSRRVLETEHGTFTPLIVTTTGGMGKECMRYSRLAELIALKEGEECRIMLPLDLICSLLLQEFVLLQQNAAKIF